VRAPRAGRHGAREPCSIRSGGAGGSLREPGLRVLTSSISTVPSRQAGQRGGSRSHPRDGGDPIQLGGASATPRPSRLGWKKASTASSSAPPRCAIRRWSDLRRANSPIASRSVSTPAPARWRVGGWGKNSELTSLELARRFEDAGVAALIYTDIARDGLLKGLNLDAAIALADEVSIPVIASGGLASIADVKALLEPRAKKLAGAVAGPRAL